MSILDEAAKLGQAEKENNAQDIDAIFEKQIVLPLQYLLSNAPTWLKEIKAYAPTAEKVIQKVQASPFWRDQSVGHWCDELAACTRNVVPLSEGLERYKRLTPQCVLNRSGKYDATIAAGVRNEISGLLACGRGCADRMKELVAMLEDRIRYLMEHQGILPPSPDSPGGVEIQPPLPQPKANATVHPVNTFFDPRGR